MTSREECCYYLLTMLYEVAKDAPDTTKIRIRTAIGYLHGVMGENAMAEIRFVLREQPRYREYPEANQWILDQLGG